MTATRIWLGGSGRSGTTWTGQLLAAAGATVTNEPLHDGLAPLPAWARAEAARPGRVYLRPAQARADWRQLVDDIFAGRRANGWTLYGMQPRWRRPLLWWRRRSASQTVVKEIVSNLMLGWLCVDERIKVVHLVRHPCATIASQMRRGWGGDPRPLLACKPLVEDFLHGVEPDILRWPQKDSVHGFALRWAIENVVPLKQAREAPILTLRYEALMNDPKDELGRLADFLGWSGTIVERVAASRSYGRPVAGLSATPDRVTQTSGWREVLDPAEIATIARVVRAFGIDLYQFGDE